MIESHPTVALSVSTSRVSTGQAESTHSVWHVFTEVGTQVMTLGALEAALLRGDVSLSTLVWIPGMVEWEPLSAVANLQQGSLVAADPERVPDVNGTPRQGCAEPERRRCSCARSTHLSRTNAPRKALTVPPGKGSYGGRTRHSRDRTSLRRRRHPATLAAALVLILLGGWHLAEAVAQQHQRSTAPAPTPPAEAARH